MLHDIIFWWPTHKSFGISLFLKNYLLSFQLHNKHEDKHGRPCLYWGAALVVKILKGSQALKLTSRQLSSVLHVTTSIWAGGPCDNINGIHRDPRSSYVLFAARPSRGGHLRHDMRNVSTYKSKTQLNFSELCHLLFVFFVSLFSFYIFKLWLTIYINIVSFLLKHHFHPSMNSMQTSNHITIYFMKKKKSFSDISRNAFCQIPLG